MRDFAISLSREVGAILRSRFRSGVAHTVKADGSFVTEVDEKVNRLVIDRVRSRFPSHDVYGEELSSRTGSDYLWVCDPIDGTNAFAHNVPTFVFSLALTRGGTPVLGVIYDPMLDRLYVADELTDTELNGTRVAVSRADSIAGTLIGACLFHGAKHEFSPVIPKLIEAQGKVQNYGSIAYMAMLVASGELSCAIYPGAHGHDIAAAKIIIENAGGKVTSFSNEDQRYDGEIDGAILSNGLVHGQVLEIIHSCER